MNDKITYLELSVVIPVFNEEDNIKLLHEKLTSSLKDINYEVIFIDDKSTDKSLNILEDIEKKDSHVTILRFAKNFGQSSAWDAGIKVSKGEYLVTMDADLQNDPADIPKLLRAIKTSDYDVISGWRKNRKDSFSKKLFSIFSNTIRRLFTDERIHDSGCSLKIYKRECFNKVNLYGEMHRYVASILSIEGYKIGEIQVNHHSRHAGKTKYGIKRLFKGSLDLFFIVFLTKYSSRPLHFFGGAGFLTFTIGFLIGLYTAIKKFIYGVDLLGRQTPILSMILVIVGVQLLFFGVLAEILMRIYYKTYNMTPYLIKNKK